MKDRAPSGAASGLEKKTDQELIEECLANNAAAWECLIVRYERLIFSIPIRMGIPHQEAADIFQCVCFILFKKLSTLRNFEKISSWLITTTRRECWRIGAQKRRESTATQSFTSTQAGAANISAEAMAYERRADDEQKQAVRDAVSSLPERCRDLLTMLFYLHEEMSYADIASKMNIPESSIGPTRARCLQKLKTLLRSKVAPGCISDPEAHLY